jgi:hypothetical protein
LSKRRKCRERDRLRPRNLATLRRCVMGHPNEDKEAEKAYIENGNLLSHLSGRI